MRVAGDLKTAAEMLSCGKASAPALLALRRNGARPLTVSEEDLLEAPRVLASSGGPATTPSGAAGLAGLMAALADPEQTRHLGLERSSRVLVLVTERALD